MPAAVADHRMHPGGPPALVTPAPAVLAAGRDDHPAVLHLGEHGRLLAHLQFPEIAQLGAREVTAGQELQQITDRVDLERGERLGRLVADDPVEFLPEAAIELGPPDRLHQSSPINNG